MKALTFTPQVAPAVLSGSVVLTLRRARSNVTQPKVGERLALLNGSGRVMANASCVMRTALWFNARGLAKVQHDGLATDAPPRFHGIGNAIVDAGSTDVRAQELGLHALAIAAGFTGWTDLWAYFSSAGRLDANGQALRHLIGWGPLDVPE